MATACLNRVSAALKTSSAVDICLEQFRSAGKVDKKTAATECAPASLDRLRELLKSKHGIRISKLEDKEIAIIVEDAQTKESSSLTAKEYQELMEHVVKYAALRARRSPRRRFAVGVVCSAASAVAVTAVTAAASTGVLVAAAPVGAAVGALAVSASSLGLSKRDKKRAYSHIPPTPATTADAADEAATAEAGAEAAPAVAQADEAAAADVTPVPPAAAPAGAEVFAADETAEPAVQIAAPAEAADPALLGTQTTPKSDELVSAVVEVSSPAAAAAAAPGKETPFSGVTAPFPAFHTDDLAAPAAPAPTAAATAPADNTDNLLAAVGAALADADAAAGADREPEALPLPDLLRCDTPDHADSAQELLTPAASLDVARSSDLPPLGKKKKSSASKKLKKSISKGYKSFKKAMSINSSRDLDAAAAAAVARADKDVAAVPPSGAKPPSGFSFRRSFSRDSARDMDAEGLSVQGSEGSATLKKMKELLRRSFTISPRTSLDVSNSGSGVRAL